MSKKFTQVFFKSFIIPVLIAAGHLTVLAQSGIYGGGARTANEAGQKTSFSSAPVVKGFILYPNPANSELILAADEDLTGVFMQVFDMTGRSVMSFRNTINRLDLSRLRPGVYTLVFNRNGSNVARQFIKQ